MGLPVNLLDTAGFNAASDDPVEREGMRRARDVMARADLVLWMSDARETDADSVAQMPEVNPGARRWTVRNKIDLLDGAPERGAAPNVFPVSAVTGAGVEDLVTAIVAFAREALAHQEPALVTRERQRARLTEVNAALRDAIDAGRTGRRRGAGRGGAAPRAGGPRASHGTSGRRGNSGRDLPGVLCGEVAAPPFPPAARQEADHASGPSQSVNLNGMPSGRFT